jgi:hypothetical protein
MICRAGLAALLAGVAWLTVAAAAEGDVPRSVSSYYAARVDPRLCPSPKCGGTWVSLVNRKVTQCGDGAAQRECYAAKADLSRLRVGQRRRAELGTLLARGRALARGRLVRRRVPGFPELDTLVVSEVWVASSSRRARGPSTTGVHRLRGNLVVCVTTPCFTIHAAELNTGDHVDVSDVDLTRTGAPPSEQRRALEQITAKSSLLATGRVLRKPNRGRAREGGRTFVASQFYEREPG